MTAAVQHVGKKKGEREAPSGDGGGCGSCGSLDPDACGVAIIVLIIVAVVLAEIFVLYAVACAFTYVFSFGETRKAKKYYKKAAKFGLIEAEGTVKARKLHRTELFFTALFSTFAGEELVRFVFHTGSATFSDLYGLAVWGFRFTCLGIFVALTAVFVVRLVRWRSFKSTPTYEKTAREIEACEKELREKRVQAKTQAEASESSEARTCPACGSVVRAKERFCRTCGAAIGEKG